MSDIHPVDEFMRELKTLPGMLSAAETKRERYLQTTSGLVLDQMRRAIVSVATADDRWSIDVVVPKQWGPGAPVCESVIERALAQLPVGVHYRYKLKDDYCGEDAGFVDYNYHVMLTSSPQLGRKRWLFWGERVVVSRTNKANEEINRD